MNDEQLLRLLQILATIHKWRDGLRNGSIWFKKDPLLYIREGD